MCKQISPYSFKTYKVFPYILYIYIYIYRCVQKKIMENRIIQIRQKHLKSFKCAEK